MAFLRAIAAMVRAGAIGALVYGDKEAPARRLFDLNSTHVLDLAELGGCEATGADVLYEVKVSTPLKAGYSAGNGSAEKGGAPATVGAAPLYGFGSAEESLRKLIYGHKARGRKSDGPLDHSTGRGWVGSAKGQYADALRKGLIVNAMIVEALGGIAPASLAVVRHLTRRSAGNARVRRIAQCMGRRASARSPSTRTTRSRCPRPP